MRSGQISESTGIRLASSGPSSNLYKNFVLIFSADPSELLLVDPPVLTIPMALHFDRNKVRAQLLPSGMN